MCTDLDNANRMRSALECALFRTERPDRVFCYPDGGSVQRGPARVTTWIGDPLGRVVWVGHEWTSNMGDKRQAIRVLSINGDVYHGTLYGTYCRLRRVRT